MNVYHFHDYPTGGGVRWKVGGAKEKGEETGFAEERGERENWRGWRFKEKGEMEKGVGGG